MAELHHSEVALSPDQCLKHEKLEINLTVSIPIGTKKEIGINML